MATRPATPPKRERDAERTRAEILEVAKREFADHGFDGARVDEIAASTRTTKRMIYYYFGSKEKLYGEVLKQAYTTIRAAEQTIDVDHSDPAAAIRRLAELTFDHHESHPDFIRLVSIENIARAEHMAKFAIVQRAEQSRDRRHRQDPRARLRRRRLHAEGRPDRPAHDDQRLLRVPRREPIHVPDDLRTRPDRRSLRDHYRQMLGDMVVGYLTSD